MMPHVEKAMPLSGIRVADFSWVSAGPRGTRMLANFGAEVIKIESAARLDMNRGRPPFAPGKRGVNASGVFNNINCDKLSVTLNLACQKGRELAMRIVAISDLVVDNFTPGAMDRMGLGYDELVAVKPDIIVLSMPVMGKTGPRRHFAGYGMGIEAISGLKSISGFPDQAPLGTGIAYPDCGPNPRHAIVAVLAALHYRSNTGRGQYIELAQYESSVCYNGSAILEYTANGTVPVSAGGRVAHAAPHGAYRCLGEDRWCVIAVSGDAEWARFAAAIGNPAWTNDDRFATHLARKRNENELDRLVQNWTMQRDPREVMDLLQAAGVAAGVVQNGRDLLEDDLQLRAVGHYVQMEHPEAGRQTVDGVRIVLSDTPGRVRRPAPLLGEHNEYVLKELLHLSDEDFDSFIVEQVIY